VFLPVAYWDYHSGSGRWWSLAGQKLKLHFINRAGRGPIRSRVDCLKFFERRATRL
jgi:hypothetical protein